jgi:hypothetical protein
MTAVRLHAGHSEGWNCPPKADMSAACENQDPFKVRLVCRTGRRQEICLRYSNLASPCVLATNIRSMW